MNDTITVTKIVAARRQLRTAIELWFADADPISIHTLSAASFQIIYDLNKKNRGPDLLLDTKFVKDEYRKEFVNKIKNASNFLKHADKGKMGLAKTFEFNPESNNHFILFAIIGLKFLGEPSTAEERAYELWQVFRNPNLLKPAVRDDFSKEFTIEAIAKIQDLGKQDFLEVIRKGYNK